MAVAEVRRVKVEGCRRSETMSLILLIPGNKYFFKFPHQPTYFLFSLAIKTNGTAGKPPHSLHTYKLMPVI